MMVYFSVKAGYPVSTLEGNLVFASLPIKESDDVARYSFDVDLQDYNDVRNGLKHFRIENEALFIDPIVPPENPVISTQETRIAERMDLKAKIQADETINENIKEALLRLL